MAIYVGKEQIAGNGEVPYINTETGNWVISGEDTGIQAYPEDIDVDLYNTKMEEGTLDTTRKYNITGLTPKVIERVIVPQNSWSGNSPSVSTVNVDGITSSDVINIAVSETLGDEDYIINLNAITAAQIKRVKNNNGTISLLSYGTTPLMDLVLDIIVLKTVKSV